MSLVVIFILMTLVFLEDKIEVLQTQFEKLINNPQTTVMELTQLLGNFFQAVLPSRLHQRYLKYQMTQDEM